MKTKAPTAKAIVVHIKTFSSVCCEFAIKRTILLVLVGNSCGISFTPKNYLRMMVAP